MFFLSKESLFSNANSFKNIFYFSDELVAETKMKLDSKARDLFKSCVDEVKAFLSEDPYKEFRKLENIILIF